MYPHNLCNTSYVFPFLNSLFQRPRYASEAEVTKFHSDDYIDFLRLVTPDNMNEYSKQLIRCKDFYIALRRFQSITALFMNLLLLLLVPFATVNVGEDCPVFDGMFQFCQISAGGSLGTITISELRISSIFHFIVSSLGMTTCSSSSFNNYN